MALVCSILLLAGFDAAEFNGAHAQEGISATIERFPKPLGAGFGHPLRAENSQVGSPLVDASGPYVYSFWSKYLKRKRSGLIVAASEDHGATYSEPYFLTKMSGVLVPVDSVVIGERVFLLWWQSRSTTARLFLSRSDDGGRSFVDPTFISCCIFRSTGTTQLLIVEDTVVILWNQDDGKLIKAATSIDNGETFLTHTLKDAANRANGPVVIAAGDNLFASWHEDGPADGFYVACSTDRGRTFAAPVKVVDSCCWPAIAADGENVVLATSFGQCAFPFGWSRHPMGISIDRQ